MEFIDSSVLVAAMVGGGAFHKEDRSPILGGAVGMYAHGLSETFSTLTGGRRNYRLRDSTVSTLLENHFAHRMSIQSLTPTEILRAMREAETRGVRGGAVFDFLHLVAARRGKASRFFTLNVSQFRTIHRAGDPEILHP